MKKRALLQIGLAIVLILLILRGIDFPTLMNAFLKINVLFIGLAIFSYFLMNLVTAYRLQKSLKYMGRNISLKTSIWSQLFGMLCSDATPGRAGYISLAYLLKKKTKIPISTSLAAIGVCQAIEFLIKILLSVGGLVYLLPFLEKGEIISTVAIGLVFLFVCGFGFLLFCWWKDILFLKKFLKKIPWGEKIYDFLGQTKDASGPLRKAVPVIILLTILGWILRGIEWNFLGYAVGVTSISIFGYLMLHPLITAIRFVPLTPAGIGMFEWFVIIIFAFFGIPVEKALLFSLFDRIDNIVLDLVTIGEMKHV